MGRNDDPGVGGTVGVDDELTAIDGVAVPARFDSVLVPLLAAGLSQRSAAERAGCSPVTVERCVQDPQFRLLLVEAHQEIRDQLLASSVSAAQAATQFLLGVVQGRERATMNMRVRAAIALRSGVVAWVERDEL